MRPHPVLHQLQVAHFFPSDSSYSYSESLHYRRLRLWSDRTHHSEILVRPYTMMEHSNRQGYAPALPYSDKEELEPDRIIVSVLENLQRSAKG